MSKLKDEETRVEKVDTAELWEKAREITATYAPGELGLTNRLAAEFKALFAVAFVQGQIRAASRPDPEEGKAPSVNAFVFCAHCEHAVLNCPSCGKDEWRLRHKSGRFYEDVRMRESKPAVSSLASLKALVEKWENDIEGVEAMGYSQQADRIRDCRDELDQILASVGEGSGQEGK